MFLAIKMAVVAVGAVVALFLVTPVDDSDASIWNRSGANIITDHLTGCQYFSRMFAMTPRLGADGKQICKSTK